MNKAVYLLRQSCSVNDCFNMYRAIMRLSNGAAFITYHFSQQKRNPLSTISLYQHDPYNPHNKYTHKSHHIPFHLINIIIRIACLCVAFARSLFQQRFYGFLEILTEVKRNILPVFLSDHVVLGAHQFAQFQDLLGERHAFVVGHRGLVDRCAGGRMSQTAFLVQIDEEGEKMWRCAALGVVEFLTEVDDLWREESIDY